VALSQRRGGAEEEGEGEKEKEAEKGEEQIDIKPEKQENPAGTCS
jgi:hypothetical protein